MEEGMTGQSRIHRHSSVQNKYKEPRPKSERVNTGETDGSVALVAWLDAIGVTREDMAITAATTMAYLTRVSRGKATLSRAAVRRLEERYL